MNPQTPSVNQRKNEFPLPDPRQRERISRGMLPLAAPVASDVDFAFLARQFELSGGNICNTLSPPRSGPPLTPTRSRWSTSYAPPARELQKMGRLPSRMEFGEYYGVVGEG